MKLNLGCGGVYKKEYLNIDAFDSTVADKIMSAVDLDLKDNSVEEIIASQLIEHLGLMSSIYTLSECYRVLESKGTLIIETPDIKTSFKKYITGGREDRKNILPWIYGLENPGLQHKFCFPDDLLGEICKNIGFTNIKTEHIEPDEYQPILKMTCNKPIDHQYPQFITFLRKQLLRKKAVDLHNQILGLEQERLIDFFSSKMNQLDEKVNNVILNEITIEGAVSSPEITNIFLESLLKKRVVPQKRIDKHLKTIKSLIKLDFLDILCYSMREIPDLVGEQKRVFHTITDLGKSTVKNLLDDTKKSTVIKSLSKTKKKCRTYDTIDFFSEKMLLKKANRLFQRGSKEFVLQRYDEAINNFKISIGFYRDQILTYWNLGRLYTLTNNRKQSKKYYKKTLDLLKLLDYNNKEIIKNKIEEEVSKLTRETPKNPITSLENIVDG